MIKRSISTSIISFYLISSCIYANTPCSTYPGAYICENGTANDIEGIYGGVVLINMNVTGLISSTAGAMSIDGCTISKINGKFGSFEMKDSILSGKLLGMIGAVNIKNSMLHGDVHLQTPTVELTNTKSKNIIINSTQDKILVSLAKNSYVDGDIRFDKNHGKVCIDGSSRINGVIINGEISESTC